MTRPCRWKKLRYLNASAAGWSVRETRCRWRWTNDMDATLTKFRYRAAAIRRASSSPPLIMKRFRTCLHTHFLGSFVSCVARHSRGRRTRCVRAMHRFRAPSVAFRRALSDAVHTPVRAGNAPIKFDAVKDKPYSWCTCGLSKKQPLCDGSHKGTGLKSLKVVPTESKPIMLCTCKLTKNTDGGCDGSHKIPVT